MTNIEVIWFGEEKLRVLRSFDCAGHAISSQPFFENQYQKIRLESTEQYIEFLVSVHEEGSHEYEYIDFEFNRKEISEERHQLPKIGFYLKHYDQQDNDSTDLIGTYKSKEMIGNIIAYQNIKNAKLVCRSVFLPSLDLTIRIGSYPDSLEIIPRLQDDAQAVVF
jgi:hypothetical protein